MLTEEQIKNIIDAKTAVLATADNFGKPRCIVLMPSRVEKDRIIVCNIQMNKTFENLKQNKNCFINVYLPEKEDLQYKIEGEAEIVNSGKLFDEIKNYEENDNGLIDAGLCVNDIIIVNIKNIEESKG